MKRVSKFKSRKDQAQERSVWIKKTNYPKTKSTMPQNPFSGERTLECRFKTLRKTKMVWKTCYRTVSSIWTTIPAEYKVFPCPIETIPTYLIFHSFFDLIFYICWVLIHTDFKKIISKEKIHHERDYCIYCYLARLLRKFKY